MIVKKGGGGLGRLLNSLLINFKDSITPPKQQDGLDLLYIRLEAA